MKFAYENFGFLRKRGKLYIVIIVLSICISTTAR